MGWGQAGETAPVQQEIRSNGVGCGAAGGGRQQRVANPNGEQQTQGQQQSLRQPTALRMHNCTVPCYKPP